MQRRVLVRKKATAPPQQVKIQANPIEAILTNFDLDQGQKLSREEVETLQDLQFPNGDPILTQDNPFVVIDVLNLLRHLPYENVINYLETSLNPHDLSLNSPLLESEHERVQMEIDNLQSTIEAEEGVYQCPKPECGGYRTLSRDKQVRSADEPMTTFVRCLDCGQRWRID